MRQLLAASMIAVLALGTGTSHSQVAKNPPAKGDSLEELQAEALKNNADMKVALAKLRLAEAKFEQARAALLAQVAIAHTEAESARAAAAEATLRYKRHKDAFDRGALAGEDFGAAKLTLEKLNGEKQLKEARLNVLLGRAGSIKPKPVDQK